MVVESVNLAMSLDTGVPVVDIAPNVKSLSVSRAACTVVSDALKLISKLVISVDIAAAGWLSEADRLDKPE